MADRTITLGGIPAVEGIASLLPLILIFVLFYFLVIRRGQRQQQQVRDVQRSLAVGQQVVTTAGLYATVMAVEDDVVVLEIAPGVHTRYARAAVARVVEPGPAPEAMTEPTPDVTIPEPTGSQPTGRLEPPISPPAEVGDIPGTSRPDAARDSRPDRP